MWYRIEYKNRKSDTERKRYGIAKTFGQARQAETELRNEGAQCVFAFGMKEVL